MSGDPARGAELTLFPTPHSSSNLLGEGLIPLFDLDTHLVKVDLFKGCVSVRQGAARPMFV